MPLPPLGHTLLTQPRALEGGVFIPDLPRRMHELPPPDVELVVAGDGAAGLAAMLQSRGRRAIAVSTPLTDEMAPDRPGWRLWRADEWVETRLISPGVRVLDFGCGSGRDAVALAARDLEVTGFDALPDALLRACDLESRYGDGLPITWTQNQPGGSYGLVLLLRCGRAELLNRALEYLAPGGLLWLTGKTDVFADLSRYRPIHVEAGPIWTRAEFAR